MTAAETLRILNVALIVACMAIFAPAIRHARDNIDRLYLLGGAALLTAGAGGSISHLHDRFNPWVLVAIAAEAVWIVAAWKSRKRRLTRRPGGGCA